MPICICCDLGQVSGGKGCPYCFNDDSISFLSWKDYAFSLARKYAADRPLWLAFCAGAPLAFAQTWLKLWVNIVSLVHNLLLGKEMFDLEPTVVVQCCNYSSFSLRWLYFGAFSRNLLTVRATEQLPAQCAPVSRVRPWPAKELPTIHSFKPIYCLLLVSAACSLWQVIIKDCKDTVPKRS